MNSIPKVITPKAIPFSLDSKKRNNFKKFFTFKIPDYFLLTEDVLVKSYNSELIG